MHEIQRCIWLIAGILSVAAPAGAVPADIIAPIPPEISSALADPRRPAEQVKLDSARKPAVVVAFSGLKAGDRVADFMPGNGYFTRILSTVVGPRGRVYAFIPREQIANCPPSEIAGTQAMAGDPGFSNVTLLSSPLGQYRMPEKLDLIWTAQNYHDLHDAFLGPANVAALNKALFNSLKPGGVLLVIDHVAAPGSGLRDTETLHRIDPAQMRAEIEAAGFVLEAQSDVLRNAADDHQRPVFDPEIRGKTDQVVLRFRRPRS
jgi:predicted methyltransferase